MYKFLFLALFISLVSCKNRNTPNLPEKQFQGLLSEVSEATTFVFPDSSYVPPAGARYTEIRAVDPANPPAIIDIVGNMNNKKKFKLSDFASSVRYVFLQPSPGMEKMTHVFNIVSDDERIFVNADEGLLCYSTEGHYLYTVVTNQREGNSLISGILFLSNIDLHNGKLIFRTAERSSGVKLNVCEVEELDAQMRFNAQRGELHHLNPQPTYQRRIKPKGESYVLMDDNSLFISNMFGNALTGVAIYGDTLCKFNVHNHLPAPRTPAGVGAFTPSFTYRIDGKIMLRNVLSDTVFRVIPPNRIVPAYVLQRGEFRLRNWIETPRFIFIHCTDSEDNPNRRRAGEVKDHWATYDKTAKTLTHHITGKSVLVENTTIHPMFENDIDPVGMPFYPEGINHRNEMYMIFNKEQIKRHIDSKLFKNDKLQTIYDNMSDDGFCLMIVK